MFPYRIKNKHIMFAGPSGIGKTTLAKWLEEYYQIPYISGSVSTLIPVTKEMTHQEMLGRDSKDLVMEDYQILNLRNKLFQSKIDESPDSYFVTDRSYLDLAAYFLYKQADKIPQCEVEQFLDLCLMCLAKQCTHLIYLPYTAEAFKSWVIEDNKKRITSKYFQLEISAIMRSILNIWGIKDICQINYTMPNFFKFFKGFKRYDDGMYQGVIHTPYGSVKVAMILELDLLARQVLIANFLGV